MPNFRSNFLERLYIQVFQPRNLLVAAALVALVWFIASGSRDSDNVSADSVVDSVASEDPPPTGINIDKRSEVLLSQSTESQQLQTLLEERFEDLAEYYSRELRGISPDPLEWVLPSFVATGVDRDSIGLRHDGSEIKIGRWRFSDTAPKFTSKDAFKEFFQNSLMAWKQASQFGIQFKIYASKTTDKEIEADVVADIFGQVKFDRGRQATSLWKTKWTRGVDNELQLQSVSIQAQEEVVVDVAGGALLQDCTESIMVNCSSYVNQLKYGLDQWARQVPRLDIVGNQGLAIGDVNNDGLDDLYICQGHGLPNQMLIQNPDGTVSDHSKLNGVDVLDESRGALLVDFDNDSDQDLAISTDDHVILYSNKGDGRFQFERKLQIGFGGQSLAAADFDQDGDLDLFVCKNQQPRAHADLKPVPSSNSQCEQGGRNVLLRNDEGWNFSDVTESVGLTEHNSSRTRNAVWVDIDSDGDQDLFVANEASSNRIYENQNGWFSDITDKLNLNRPGRNRSASIGDFNRDGRPDLFVATDVTTATYRTIEENKKPDANLSPDTAALLSLSHFWQSTDRKPSETKTQSTQTALRRPQRLPNAAFTNYPLRVPIFTSESSFASAVADLNNDGLDDVLVSNGYLTRTSSDDLESFLLSRVGNFDPEKISVNSEVVAKSHDVFDLIRTGFSLGANQRNRCYLSLGALGFANFSAASGLDILNDSRAIATTDWDGDGDIDVVMTSRNGPQVRIFCNQLKTENGYLQLNVEGTKSNRDAIGTRVEVFIAGQQKPLVKFVTAGSGNLSQSSKRITFGLGTADEIKKVIVVWPTGESQTFSGILPNRQYDLVEGVDSAAELSTNRFELAIKPRAIRNNFQLPPSQRSVFYPPSALPILSIQDADENWIRLKVRDDKPTLVTFFSNNSPSESVLTMIAENKNEIGEAKLDCVAVFVDGTPGETDIQTSIRSAKQLTDATKFPFRWGVASEESIEKLQLLCGDWFSHQQLPQVPFAILLDNADYVRAFYPTGELDIGFVIKDKPFFRPTINEPSEKRRGYNGKWISPYRYTDLGRLKNRFLELGFEEDAMWLNSISNASLAKRLAKRAIELASQREYEKSKLFFDRAIDVDRNCVIAYIGQGELLREVAAEQELEKEDVKVQMLANAASSFQFALDVDPFNVEAAIGRANVAIDQNRPSIAIEELKKYMEYNPQSAEMKAIMGRLLFATKEYREAATYLTAAFDMHPSLPFVAGDLGFLYLSAGEYKQALKFLRLAHRLQPSDKNVIRLLAEAELVTGNYKVAVTMFEDVVRLHPNRVRPKNILAWLLATSPFEEHRNAEQADEIIQPLLDLFGETSAATLEISAAIMAEQGDFEQAVEQQQKALDLLRKESATDQYSEKQKKGLTNRLELYRRNRPYRSNDLSELPFKRPGNRNAK
jgi:tetratricopeptide (TPR) repeat protein